MDVESVRSKYEQYLLSLPNVNGVWSGVVRGKPGIIVAVTHKVPLDRLAPEERIPTQLDGYDVDVFDAGGEIAAPPPPDMHR
jgi:hypothetical protein